MGIKLLGATPEPLSDRRDDDARGVDLRRPATRRDDEDVERYAIMSADSIQDPSLPELQPQTGDPVTLISTSGPFTQINQR